MKDKIYIFGHKNPDTDSVCSSIALSYLKNTLGFNTEARILSNINEETKYVLNKFKINIPEILEDVKLQVKNIDYHKDFRININKSVYNAFFEMQNNNMSTIPVVDNNNIFLGSFAMKDIARQEILGDSTYLYAKYDYILEVLNGQEILKFKDEIKGNITNIDLRSTTFKEEKLLDKNSILVVGNRHSIIEDAINNSVTLIVVTGNNIIKDEHLELAKKKKVNIIYTKKDTYETLLKIKFANYIFNYPYQKGIVTVNEKLDVSDLNDIINKTKHSYYPVLNNKNECLGLIKLSDLRNTFPKKVILVDHNEITQSVDGLDEADILEIIDHHKLGILGTTKPISFRNMTVGSTCTIVYELFKENKVKIPPNIADLLMSGIISDTLMLKSATSTKEDEIAINNLSKLANIDAMEFAISMFKAGDVVKSKSIKDIVYMDYKVYEIDKKNIGIGQVTTLNSKAILKQKHSYINFLDKEAKAEKFDVMILLVTDIFKNGSYILFNESAKNIIVDCFNGNVSEGIFLENIMSRKKQVLPEIIKVLK